MTTNGTKPNGRVTKARKPPVKGEPKVPDGKLRLLKVLVQPVYALDTADGLIEVSGVPVEEVNGAGWVMWALQRFTPEALEATRQELTPVPPVQP